jgi:hypothetical protein
VKDDLRTLCYEHKKEYELAGYELEFIREAKKEPCDKCDCLGFTYRIKDKRNKRREKYNA